MEIIGYLLTGASAAAIIKLIDNIIQWKLNRKAKLEDDTAAKEEQLKQEESEWHKRSEERDEALTVGLRVILLDRIQHLGQSYISNGEVDFDDRRRLNDMHHVYHFSLGGNGDLDVLMAEVNALPLKKEGA